jgi:hypothetical protein
LKLSSEVIWEVPFRRAGKAVAAADLTGSRIVRSAQLRASSPEPRLTAAL